MTSTAFTSTPSIGTQEKIKATVKAIRKVALQKGRADVRIDFRQLILLTLRKERLERHRLTTGGFFSCILFLEPLDIRLRPIDIHRPLPQRMLTSG